MKSRSRSQSRLTTERRLLEEEDERLIFLQEHISSIDLKLSIINCFKSILDICLLPIIGSSQLRDDKQIFYLQFTQFF